MRKYHLLTVAGLENETADSVRVALRVPDEVSGEFDFLPGQHLPIQTEIDGKPVRRTANFDLRRPLPWPARRWCRGRERCKRASRKGSAMTDRLEGCTVIFEKPLREDDAEGIISAIRHISGVRIVEPVTSTSDCWMAAERARDEMRDGLLRWLGRQEGD